MILPFAAASYARGMGLPEQVCANFLTEATPGLESDSRIPRPGLVSAYALGSGPARGVFHKPGLFSGALFIVSAATLYLSDGTNLGTIAGTDLVRWAASSDQLVIVGGGLAYCYDGSTLTQITDPDLPTVSDVAYFGGRFVFTQDGSDQFWWSAVSDATSIDGLGFATAEESADLTLGVLVIGDRMYFFGGDTVECWGKTSDADNPFQKSEGQGYVKGCASRDTICTVDNAPVWVGADRVVYRGGNGADRISHHGIEAALRDSEDLSSATAFAAHVDGHELYVLNVPGQGSWTFDAATKQWAAWSSYERTTFRGRAATYKDGVNYVADDTTATVWSLTPGTKLDGTDPISFELSAFLPSNARFERCDRARLECVMGVGEGTGQGADPVVELCWSDDQGRTWGNWISATLGKVGEYAKRARWNRLGAIRPPGRVFRVRCTDPVAFVTHGLDVNFPL